MKTYGTLYNIILKDSSEKITVNIPNYSDMFFPYCKPNDNYLIKQNVTIINPEIFEKTPFIEGQIVYGNNIIKNDFQNNMEVINNFEIERFLTLEEYKNE